MFSKSSNIETVTVSFFLCKWTKTNFCVRKLQNRNQKNAKNRKLAIFCRHNGTKKKITQIHKKLEIFAPAKYH